MSLLRSKKLTSQQHGCNAPKSRTEAALRVKSRHLQRNTCPLWVMNGQKATSALSPFDSQLRTLVGAARRSHSCHERTHAPLLEARTESISYLISRAFPSL